MRTIRILLIVIAVVCFGVALSYPIRYRLAQNENNANMEGLSALRSKTLQDEGDATESTVEGTPSAEGASGVEDKGSAASEAEVEPDAGPAAETEAVPEAESLDTPEVASTAAIVAVAEAEPERETGAEPEAESAPGNETGIALEAEPDSEAWDEPEDELGDEDDVPAMPKRPTISSEGAAGEDGPQSGDRADPRASDVPEGASAEGQQQSASTQGEDGPRPGDLEMPADEGGNPDLTDHTEPTPTPEPTPEPTPVANPDLALLLLEGFETPAPTPRIGSDAQSQASPTPEPVVTPVWDDYKGPLPYPMLEKVELDKSRMLPELREIYALNNDLVGWITVPGTVIDYPVVQCEDSDYYLEHDFYGNANINGQIILDTLCDPYTPSYNLIISGHHMKNGSMFGDLPEYRTHAYWEKHKLIEFDSLMFRKQYVVFAAFYSADYDENEEGFRYNANIQYKMEANQWLREIEDNKLYDTGIDVQFGDEFITLTTCNRARHRNGRFVVVARKVREGETIE